ncbi:Uncharacterised protein [Mycobacteroides abscessus subsp. abscessus]|nr:Uncharacterised protein [Mycobacteroides abscessus subsp. abscessus]
MAGMIFSNADSTYSAWMPSTAVTASIRSTSNPTILPSASRYSLG